MRFHPDPGNRAALLALVVEIDGNRMTVAEALRLRLMIHTADMGVTFDARHCAEQAPYLVDMITGLHRTAATALPQHHAPGLQPRQR